MWILSRAFVVLVHNRGTYVDTFIIDKKEPFALI